MQMRNSRVLQKLREGKVVSCMMTHLDEQVTEIIGEVGFDCVWLDGEHQAKDWTFYQKHIYAAKNYDMDVMIRVPRGSYSDYIKPLEMDSTGIMVPHIMSADDARNVIRMTRFHPIGRRPIDSGNSDGKYAQMNLSDYVKQANEKRFIMVQIEDPEPLDELDEIASLDGIDILFFGPGDFSHSIGAPGQWDHPELIEARRRVAEVAVKHGKFAGIPASSGNMEELIEMGYRFLAIGADVIGIAEYSKKLLKEFDEKTKEF